jgi:S1-C subfamily serine protease
MDLLMAGDSIINAQQHRALVERIACHTIGIAANDNTCIGTGTLVTIDQQNLVITAEHVIKDSDAQNIRFWCRPPTPIIEKAAKNLSPSEIGRLTEGQRFPIETIIGDSGADLAAIKIRSDFKLPEPNEYYSLNASRQLASWPEEELDGLSLLSLVDSDRQSVLNPGSSFRSSRC